MLPDPRDTERHEIEAWLGDDHGLVDEQITNLMRTANSLKQRYPDDDELAETGLTVAYRLMVEPHDTVLSELGSDLLRARLDEARALAGLRQAALTMIQRQRNARGITSAQGFARHAGIDRQTVLSWLE